MAKIMHVQTVLMTEELSALKQKTGEETTKDALATAVHHYLECGYTHEDTWLKKLETVIKKKQKI